MSQAENNQFPKKIWALMQQVEQEYLNPEAIAEVVREYNHYNDFEKLGAWLAKQVVMLGDGPARLLAEFLVDEIVDYFKSKSYVLMKKLEEKDHQEIGENLLHKYFNSNILDTLSQISGSF